MITLLLSSVLILGLFVLAVYLWQKPGSTSEAKELPPPPDPRSLFAEPETHLQLETKPDQQFRAELIKAAETGDKSALQQARELHNNRLYDEVLTALVTATTSDAQLLSLTSYVTRNEWPVNGALAKACIVSWQKAPNRSSTAKTLHIAALCDDAEIYGNAAELALRFWREEKIPDLTAIELNALLNGEYWVLSSATRNSGAGFILKRSLASARRELEQTNAANHQLKS
ncbi:MAG TPA: hypothetical protein VF251_06495 [Pyrinomonadaceae bacterium]